MHSRIPLSYGAATFGRSGAGIASTHAIEDAQKFIDLFVGRGYDLIDTARVYGGGVSEEILGKLDLKGARVDTKCAPQSPGDHSPEKLREFMNASLKALGPNIKIRVYYLHAPDRTVPFVDTLREINEMHKEGLFEEFGLSNFHSWTDSSMQVAEFVTLAKANGWIQPTVYQGIYNAVERMIETELVPCLRKYGIRFYAYSPLAMGILTGELLSQGDIAARGTRWNPETSFGQRITAKYEPFLPIIKPLKEVLDKHNIRLPEAALRWIQHHSALTPDDVVILGASKLNQLESNISDSEGGPLPDDVVQLLDEAWKNNKVNAKHYASA